MHNKEVSVLMPVYNGARFVAKTMESILNQSFGDFEFIVIDDASSDNSFDILSNYRDSRIRLFRNDSNIGQVKTLNKGLRLCQGEFIARIDQDDIASKNRLERQTDFLLKHKEYAATGTSAFIINEFGKKIGIYDAPTDTDCFKIEILFNNPILHPSVMIRKKALLEVGCFNEDFIFSQDYELWSRMLISGYKLTNIDEPLLFLRKHSGSSTVSLFSNTFNIEVPKIIKHNIQSLAEIDISIQDAERICKVLYAPKTLDDKEFENTIFIFEKIFKRYQDTHSGAPVTLQKTIAKFKYILALGYIERRNLPYARQKFLDSFKTYPYNPNPLIYYFFTLFGFKNLYFAKVIKKNF